MIEKLRSFISQKPKQSIGIAAMVLVLVILGLASGSGPSIEGDQASPTSGAFMVYKDAPYLPFRSTTSNNLLRDDLAFYARSIYPDKYNPEKQPAVVFNVSGAPVQSEKSLEFSGGYEKVKGKFSVKVELLKNGRIKTSIVDTKTNHNIDSELPSNSKQNQFIASLPITTDGYRVSFSGIGEETKITIRLNDSSELSRVEALNSVEAAMGSDFMNDENISVFYLSTTSSDRGEYVKIFINGQPVPVETFTTDASDHVDE